MDYVERLRTGLEVRYTDSDKDYFEKQVMRANDLCDRLNRCGQFDEERYGILEELLRKPFDRSNVLKAPFHCDLGFNITLGRDDLINYDCIFLDCSDIVLGDHVMLAPRVQLLTAMHPMDYMSRREVATTAKPVHIEDDVWIGAGALILPGVTVGARSVIGAGAVVNKDVPPDTVYAGVPAHTLHG